MEYIVGSDILLSDNDIVPNEFGDIMLVTDDYNIIQMAINNIKTILGEIDNDIDRGNAVYGRRIRMNESGMQIVAKDCSNAMAYDSRITVLSVDVIKSDIAPNTCDISFTIKRNDNNRVLSSNLAINLEV